MKFVIIKAKEKEVCVVDCKTLHDAETLAGLNRNEVDHGTVKRGVGYVVYEFGHFMPVSEQHYFAMAGRLIAGNAVLYGYDELGKTIDLDQAPIVFFFEDLGEIERAFGGGICQRPQLTVNGEVLWQWPDPPPRGFGIATGDTR